MIDHWQLSSNPRSGCWILADPSASGSPQNPRGNTGPVVQLDVGTTERGRLMSGCNGRPRTSMYAEISDWAQ